MRKQVLIAISGALVVGVVALFAIAFFWKNPVRVGEITIATPKGPSLIFKVANSNEISELIRKGLENENSADALSNSLLSIIEHLPPSSTLSEKLVELAEQRRSPFSWDSVPVRLVYDSNVPQGLAAVCEKSSLLAKNIVVYVLASDGPSDDMQYTFQAYAAVNHTFPCPNGGETVRLNSKDIQDFKSRQVGEFDRYKVLAKRSL